MSSGEPARTPLRRLTSSHYVEPERRAGLEKQRRSLLAHFEHARVKDSDLASLRGTPEFEALFEETNDKQ